MENIIYVGPINKPGTCRQRLEAFERLGYKAFGVDTSPIFYRSGKILESIGRKFRRLDLRGVNQRVLDLALDVMPSLVWVDKGVLISGQTLRRLKKCGTKLVHYSPDDYMNPINQSGRLMQSLQLYDLVVTTKSYNVDELKRLGVRHVEFVNNAYDPVLHRPIVDGNALCHVDVGFIGAYERERVDSMCSLLESGCEVAMWTPSWPAYIAKPDGLVVNEGYLSARDYAKVICSTKINLAFLRKANRDLQTTRSVEIPACMGFMLAERTDEHMSLFEEGVEAEFFSTDTEMIRKVGAFLEDAAARRKIAMGGYQRCIRSGYSNDARIKMILRLLNIKY